MRAAVLGGAGFIGSHLVERLVSEAHEVLAVDDLSAGRLENLAEARRAGRVGFHSIDVEHPRLGDLLGKFTPEVVYLLADPAPDDNGTGDPRGAVVGTVSRMASIAETVLALNARLVIAVSGAELYGAMPSVPVREAQRPHPQHPHGAALYAGLRYVEARMGAGWCATALGEVYGPRQSPERGMVASLASDMLRRRTPIVVGAATDAIDVLYVDDAVDALVRAGMRGRGLVNAGTGTPVALGEIAAQVGAAAGFTGDVEYVGSPGSIRPPAFALDASVAAERLDWRPLTPLADGIARTVEWFGDRVH